VCCQLNKRIATRLAWIKFSLNLYPSLLCDMSLLLAVCFLSLSPPLSSLLPLSFFSPSHYLNLVTTKTQQQQQQESPHTPHTASHTPPTPSTPISPQDEVHSARGSSPPGDYFFLYVQERWEREWEGEREG
jgi:hypothetical protein